MSERKQFIPRNMADFHQWFENFNEYVKQKTSGQPPEWEHISVREQNKLRSAFDEWKTVYLPLVNSRDIHAKDKIKEGREKAEKVIRPFNRRHIQCDDVTDFERTEMRVPNHDKTRTIHNEVREGMDLSLAIRGIRQIHGHIRVLGASSKAKPYGYDGAVLQWAILDNPPANVAELTNNMMVSRTPFTIHFDEADRGKKVYIAAAWQNRRKVRGPWSEIKSTFIP